MDRSDLQEVHCITPIGNLVSILELGVLSHEKARHVPHTSVAMPEVQATRARVTVPGGLRLHDYANLYFNARNVMMFKRHNQHRDICVLSIRLAVLDRPDTVLSDCNAAAVGFAEFGSVEELLPRLDRQTIFAESWNHSDYYEKRAHRSKMCAEILVPHVLPPEYIRGAWVSCDEAKVTAQALGLDMKVKLNPYLFFQGSRP